jgi:preprotein translocase subunit SecG
MFIAVISLIIGIAVLLILVILAQNSKGGGLSSQFGGSGASQVMGVKKTSDFLEKATWTLAISLLFLSMSTSFLINEEPATINSPNIEKAGESGVLPGLDFEDTGESSTEPSSGDDTESSNLEDLLEDAEGGSGE